MNLTPFIWFLDVYMLARKVINSQTQAKSFSKQWLVALQDKKHQQNMVVTPVQLHVYGWPLLSCI